MEKESIIKPIIEWHKRISTTDRRIFWLFMGVIILSLTISVMISMIRTYNNDLSPYECNQLIKKEVMLSKANSFWEVLIAKNQIVIVLLTVGIAAGWIFHGVGFKIIGT